MATINFLYRSKKERSPINLRLLFRHNDTDYVFGVKTRLMVSKIFWQAYFVDTQKSPKQTTRDIDIKNEIVKVQAALNNIENHILGAFFEVDPVDINKEWLITQMELYYNPNPLLKTIPTDLISYIDYSIEKREATGTEFSVTQKRRHNVLKKKLTRFEADRKSKILIKQIDEEFKAEFIKFCKKENYKFSTYQKDMVYIRSFCVDAKKRKLETSPDLEALIIKTPKNKKKPDPIYLSFDELEKIEKLKELTESLENAKDWLIISCYTGQRVSDLMRFNPGMIRNKGDKSLLEFTQVKTNQKTTVPLHPKVLDIMKKREGNFPRPISHQKYNDYIKDVCKAAEINQIIKGGKTEEYPEKSKKYRKVMGSFEKWELVTSHIGRRSFASNFYGIIPTMFLKNITGHKSEEMLLVYIGKSNDETALETFKYF